MPTDFLFDVDSTIIRGESLQDMVALALRAQPDDVRKNAETELKAITNAGMNGEITFEESLRRRLALAPVTQEHHDQITAEMLTEMTEGMEEFIRDLQSSGHCVWILTAGLCSMMLPLAKKLKINEDNVLANDGLWEDGRLIGCKESPLLSTEGKGVVIRKLKQTGRISGKAIMIGDGMSDLSTFLQGAADDFLGFGANAVRPKVLENAPHFFRNCAEMRSYLRI